MLTRVPCLACDGEQRTQCPECFGSKCLAYGRRNGLPYFDFELRCDVCDGEGEVKCGPCDGEGECTVETEEVTA